MRISRDNMKEENDMLKKELESLQAEIRASNLFEAELARENKELSSELDFIKDKINENQSISRDIFEKLEENSENYTKL